MATLTVEGVPPGLLSRLASTAVANGRCLNSEVILSLLRHGQEEPAREGAGRAAPVVCPLASLIHPGASRGCNVSWGDPG
jgi:hypothetical protein